MDLAKRLDRRLNKEIDKYIGKKVYKSVMQKEVGYGLHKNPQRIVVSMASYAKRYSTIIPTLKSLLLQTYKPDRIIVWLDEETPENTITEEMESLKKYGVEYRFTNDDLKPHKKYFYAMQEFKDAIIITVDDDIVYSEDMVASLIKIHKQYPKCICARRVHKINFDKDSHILPYKDWDYEYRKEHRPSYLLCATGGAGALYPAGILPEEAFEINKIKELCWRADDIWLKFMELKADVQTIWVPTRYVMPYEVNASQVNALNTTNTNGGGNDEYIKNILKEYPETQEILLKAFNLKK